MTLNYKYGSVLPEPSKLNCTEHQLTPDLTNNCIISGGQPALSLPALACPPQQCRTSPSKPEKDFWVSNKLLGSVYHNTFFMP